MKSKSALIFPLMTVGLLFFVINSYQACSKTSFLDLTQQSEVAGGNGDTYSGKVSYFLHVDSQSPCSKVSLSGKPLPNRQIFFDGQRYSLVRDECQDIEPIFLNPKDLILEPLAITYQGERFDESPDLSEYLAFSPLCPDSRSPRTVDFAADLFRSRLDLTGRGWVRQNIFNIGLFGSFEALPLWKLERSDPARLEDWQRLSQNPTLKPNTDYTFSALMKEGNSEEAIIHYHNTDAMQFGLIFNLREGSWRIHHSIGFSTAVRGAIQPYGKGYLVSIFFRTPAGLSGDPEIGFTSFRSSGVLLGDYIYATVPGLNETNNLCN